MYCIRCKKITDTSAIQFVISKNCRNMKRGTCSICGITKTQFVKQDATGKGFMNGLINKLPFEMHLPGHNFTGPGTKLSKRYLQFRKLNTRLRLPIRYYSGEEIQGTFYEQESQKTNQEVYRIEKVIKKGKTKSLVKWKGYPEAFNSWVNNRELTSL